MTSMPDHPDVDRRTFLGMAGAVLGFGRLGDARPRSDEAAHLIAARTDLTGWTIAADDGVDLAGIPVARPLAWLPARTAMEDAAVIHAVRRAGAAVMRMPASARAAQLTLPGGCRAALLTAAPLPLAPALVAFTPSWFRLDRRGLVAFESAAPVLTLVTRNVTDAWQLFPWLDHGRPDAPIRLEDSRGQVPTQWPRSGEWLTGARARPSIRWSGYRLAAAPAEDMRLLAAAASRWRTDG